MCTSPNNENSNEIRIKKALDNHKKGYNCCQAVVCSYCDLVGLDEGTAFKAAEGFGAGMGGFNATCGAVTGAVMLAGLKNSTANLNSPDSKGGTYSFSKEILSRFASQNTSIICKDLRGSETGKVLRSCDGCIEDAARIAEDILFS